jgi:hypothetical protein
MKVHVEAEQGELEARLPDLVKTLSKLAGAHEHEATEKDTEPLFPVLREILDRGRRQRDHVRQTMLAKMLAVLDAAEKAKS